jgi:hypothetical protein
MFVRSPKKSYEARKKFARNIVNSMPILLRCLLEVQKKLVIPSYEARKKFVRKMEYHVKSFICF